MASVEVQTASRCILNPVASICSIRHQEEQICPAESRLFFILFTTLRQNFCSFHRFYLQDPLKVQLKPSKVADVLQHVCVLLPNAFPDHFWNEEHADPLSLASEANFPSSIQMLPLEERWPFRLLQQQQCENRRAPAVCWSQFR